MPLFLCFPELNGSIFGLIWTVFSCGARRQQLVSLMLLGFREIPVHRPFFYITLLVLKLNSLSFSVEAIFRLQLRTNGKVKKTGSQAYEQAVVPTFRSHRRDLAILTDLEDGQDMQPHLTGQHSLRFRHRLASSPHICRLHSGAPDPDKALYRNRSSQSHSNQCSSSLNLIILIQFNSQPIFIIGIRVKPLSIPTDENFFFYPLFKLPASLYVYVSPLCC